MAETLELKQVTCPSCGSVISSFSAFATEVECPVCHSKLLNPLATAKKVPFPERIIPFKTKEEDFEMAMVQQLADTDYVPIDIFEHIGTEKVYKAYLPMFLYEGRYQSSWSCEVAIEANEVRASSDGTKVENRKVKKFVPHTGTSQGNFAFLCLAYEGEDIPKELRDFSAKFPYTVQASKEYDSALLGINQDNSPLTFAMNSDSDLVWNKLGDGLVNNLATENAKMQLSGAEFRNFRASNSYDLKNATGRYILAPFWFVYYTYNGEKYNFMMDGLGDQYSMSHPVNQEEVNFVEKRNKIEKIVKWAWPLAIVMWFITNWIGAAVTLGVWLVARLVLKFLFKSQIKKKLEASRQARRAGASQL